MKLISKKTEMNLTHIKWSSTRIRMMCALANFKINKVSPPKPPLNESNLNIKPNTVNKPLKDEAEKRVSIEDFTSNSYGQNSNFENIISLATTVIKGSLFFLIFAPIMKIKYFLWDLPFKK